MPVVEVYERTITRSAPIIVIDASPLLTCTPADPFLIDHDCRNPAGHDFIAACGDVVCPHCAKVAWS